MTKPTAKIIPISGKKPAKFSRKKSGKSSAQIYQIKVTLCETDPPIWRRLLVSGDVNLGQLHGILQISMGWTNSHLHHFISDNIRYMDPDLEVEAFDDEPLPENEFNVKLSDILPGESDKLVYEYDFGDCWEHVIQVEKILIEHKDFNSPAVCIGGERACPPEDCGGTHGYVNLCEIIMDPGHEEHEDMMAWLPDGFEPEAFDAGKVNRYLKKLKWKRPNWQQLGKILAERDGEEFVEDDYI